MTKTKNLIYIGILIAFAFTTGIFFLYSARFFSESINSAFLLDTARVEAEVVKLNVEGFRTIAPRFGINPNAVP